MTEYDTFIRYFKEDINPQLDGEGEIKLIIRDTERYCSKPVVAKVYRNWTEGKDKLWMMDPLGRFWQKEPFGLQIMKEEDEDKLFSPDYQKAAFRV